MTNIQDLRKIYSAQGIKGFSSANRAAFTANIEAAHTEALEIHEGMMVLALAAAAAQVEVAKVVEVEVAKKGMCIVCTIRKGTSKNGRDFRDMCDACYQEAGWENTHSDGDHENGTETDDACWICHPELNKAKAEAKAGRSRAGMVIVAKGSEIHKSETFRVAAEGAGWTVTMERETYELEADAEGEGTRYYATATKGDDSISLAWDGRAYDYPASSAELSGKGRKVRNLKEALRLL